MSMCVEKSADVWYNGVGDGMAGMDVFRCQLCRFTVMLAAGATSTLASWLIHFLAIKRFTPLITTFLQAFLMWSF